MRLWRLALVLLLWPLLIPAVLAIRPVYIPVQAPTAFVAVTGGYAAPIESARCGDGWQVAADASAGGGSYTSLPAGEPDRRTQCALAVDVTCNYLWVKARKAVAGKHAAWFDTAPFYPDVDNTKAWLLFGESPQPTFAWTPVGQRGNVNLVRPLDASDTAQRAFGLTPGAVLYFSAQAGVELDSFFCADDPATDPTDSGGTGIVVNYDIKQVAADIACTPVADEWTDANVVEWIGYDGTTRSNPITQLLYNPATDRMWLRIQQLDSDLRIHSTNPEVSDGITIQYRDAVSTAPRDATTIKIEVDVSGRIETWNFPATVQTAYDAGAGTAVTLVGDLDQTPDDTGYDICLSWNAGVDLVAGGLFSGDLRTYQRDSVLVGHRQAFNTVAGGFDDPASPWGVFRLSSEVASGAPPPGTPVVGTPSFSSITASGFTTTFTTDQAGTCAWQYDLDADAAVSGADASAVLSCGASVGGACTCIVTGRPASTLHQVQGRVTNATGATGLSALATVTTSASGVAYYVSPSGNDTTGTGTSGAPWKTLAKGLQQMAPGRTLILKDGTYSVAAGTGLLQIQCGAGTNYAQGTATNRITVRAENERQVTIVGNQANGMPGYLIGCAYWTIEGLTFEDGVWTGEPTDPGGDTGYVFHIENAPNYTMRRNLLYHTTDGNATVGYHSGLAVHASDGGLIEENEVYFFSRHGFSIKYTKSGTVRRNYLNNAGAPKNTDGQPMEGISCYPCANLVVENNIVENVLTSYSVISYGTSTPTQFPSDNNRYLGNICFKGTVCWSPDYRPDDTYVNAFLKQTTLQDFLCVGPTACFILRNFQTTGNVVRRLSAIGATGSGILMEKFALSPASEVYTIHPDALLSLNNGGTGVRVTSDYDAWSIDGVTSFGNNPNLNATSSGQCTNCTGVSTSDPGIGTRKVWTGLSVGAEILYAYENQVLNPNKKLWVTSAPSGWTAAGGASYERYFLGCGRVVSGTMSANATYACAGVANRLNVTNANLISGY